MIYSLNLLVKMLIRRNFWKKLREKLYRTAQCAKTRNSLTCRFFSSNQFRVKFFSKKLLSRNFCGKIVAINFHNFHSDVCNAMYTLTIFSVKLISLKSSCMYPILYTDWFHEIFMLFMIPCFRFNSII